MSSIEDRIREQLRGASESDPWLKQLVEVNPNHQHLQDLFARDPLLFESMISTEQQLLACVYGTGWAQVFPTLNQSALLAAKRVGVIPIIRDSLNDWSANCQFMNASVLAKLSQHSRLGAFGVGAALSHFGRQAISQSDYNCIANNAKRLIEIYEDSLKWFKQHNLFLNLRDPLTAPNLMNERAFALLKKNREISREDYTSTAAIAAMRCIQDLTHFPEGSFLDPLSWENFNAYAEVKLNDRGLRVILAPRHFPWQTMLPISEGFMIPVIPNPLIPLVEDVAWVCQFQPTNESPTPLPTLTEEEQVFTAQVAWHMAYSCMILTALGGLAKVGRGNTRLRWCLSPYNSSVIQHIIAG